MFELAVDGVDETRRASEKPLRTIRSGVIIVGRIWLKGSAAGVPTTATSSSHWHGAEFIVERRRC